MQITIDKGIPVAAPHSGMAIYPFGQMAVGDSFALPYAQGDSLRNAASRYGRGHGLRFSVRKVEENGVKVVRCWRVA